MPLTIPMILLYIGLMAGITYLCRVLTLVLVRKRIKNAFVNSFLTYIPYAVLAAMVFPGIFYSTSGGGVIVSNAVLIATVSGTIIAVILSFFKRGLFTVSMSATAVVLILILILSALGVA